MGASTSSPAADDGSKVEQIFGSMQEKHAFEKIIGTASVLFEDAAYYTLLAAPKSLPQLTQTQVELLTREYGEMLAQNSLESGNFCVLLRYVIQALPFGCKMATMTKWEQRALVHDGIGPYFVDNEPQTVDTHLHRAVNGLFLVRQFAMRFVERTDACPLLNHFTDQPRKERASVQSPAATTRHSLSIQIEEIENNEDQNLLTDAPNPLASRFLDALMTVLIESSPNSKTLELHVEIVNTLLVLLSPVVYPRDHSQTRDLRAHNPFLYMLMASTSHRASGMVHGLLRNVIERSAATGPSLISNTAIVALRKAHEMSLIAMSGLSDRADEQEEFSYFTLEGFGSIAASIFRFPWNFMQYITTREHSASPLADRSLLLLLVLLQSCRDSDSPAATNPFRGALNRLLDGADSASLNIETKGLTAHWSQQSDANAPADTEKLNLALSGLINVVGRHASYETSHLMLYTILYAEPMRLDPAVNNVDREQLLLPLLETLYHARSVEPGRLYMLVIVLLTFTQDASFARSAHSQSVVSNVAWYHEHYLRDVSLGSLMMVIFTRLIFRNITHFQDSFIHLNAFAALSNLARSAENLHLYAAQGIVGLIDMLAKMEATLVIQMHRVQASDMAPTQELAQKRLAYVEFIRLLLGVISSCLKAKLLPRNPQLIYSLLHRADTFAALQKHSAFGAQVKYSRVWSTVAHFQSIVRARTLPDDVLDANSVLAMIRQECVSLLAASSASSRTGGVASHKISVNNDDASYRYEEEKDPEQFFVPYIWKLIQEQTPDFCWQVDKITLFDPCGMAARTT